jgi:hypothetical protein
MELRYHEDQEVLKKMQDMEKRRALMISENYEDTYGNYRGKSMKISCPPEEQGKHWVNLDGEIMDNVDKFVTV